MADIINILNTIRANGSQMYQDRVPVATKENLTAVSSPLMEYSVLQNEFLNALVNRIGLTLIRNKTADNPLKILKQGSVPLGQDVQEIHTNPATAKAYNAQSTDLLAQTTPDVASAYHRLNRKDRYDVTIQREQLHTAFTDWGKFEELITGIVNTLYSGNYIDEFKLTKALVDGAYDNNKVIVETVTNPTDNASSKAFVKKVRSLFSKMSFPSTEYNAYSKFSGAKGEITTWTDKDRLVLMITADALAEVEVETLAQAFNLSYADMQARIVTVDKFKNEEIVGVLCDESWFQIYENIMRFDEFYNARVMAWNEYLHVWQTYAICPFANAVVLATAQPKPATAISVSDVSVNVSATADVTVTLTPADATTELEYISGDETVFTVSSLGVVTGVGAGTGTLTVKTDNGLSDTATVTVSTIPPTTP